MECPRLDPVARAGVELVYPRGPGGAVLRGDVCVVLARPTPFRVMIPPAPIPAVSPASRYASTVTGERPRPVPWKGAPHRCGTFVMAANNEARCSERLLRACFCCWMRADARNCQGRVRDTPRPVGDAADSAPYGCTRKVTPSLIDRSRGSIERGRSTPTGDGPETERRRPVPEERHRTPLPPEDDRQLWRAVIAAIAQGFSREALLIIFQEVASHC
jgi:hypothetical protein